MSASGKEQLRKANEIDIVIPCRSRIRKFAFENAILLIFLSGFFMLTWIVTVVACRTGWMHV